ncbi:uncharacterized protein N7446_009348 [Penicillium canescens]|uniref:RNase III domain-containing protein n=1 Tax=Penicillium canescens TaxID=5083 RepID=A0AAD6N5V4_PENCN|nr:uncharacterized protein N7446_009348 [Penicillium canescens]KAJ6034596.1 hypothetical protein N7460_008771 [Penicillium canescens]KAJ6046256.1 hypothetical protein N7444_007510 [Penicillium canescens]KAJ6053336.1 hypothetical protein N7446_009348 [Penicillium canescens]
MTNAQNTLATNENLARIRFSVGMDAYIQLNPSAQGVVPGRLMATTIEAIIGAVYLDRNRNTMDIRLLVIHLRIMPTLQGIVLDLDEGDTIGTRRPSREGLESLFMMASGG